MVVPPAFNAGHGVQFVVYNGQGQLQDFAQLDSTGQNKSVPNNCLNCHGGTYDNVNHIVSNAHFLPFDPQAFEFASFPGYDFNSQAKELRKLNAHVRSANPTTQISELIDGWYAPKGASDPSSTINTAFVPTGWSGDSASVKMYNEVFKPYCRTCHVTSTIPFATSQSFTQLGSAVLADTCSSHTMPHAEATLKNFWKSPARAHVVGAFGKTGAACKP
jgi:cytochrome c1